MNETCICKNSAYGLETDMDVLFINRRMLSPHINTLIL